jgi:hypothetical protein
MRSRRNRILEIDEHGGVAHRRQQEILEAAGHMRADRLALEGAGKDHHIEARDGDGKVVGPESDEAFPQRLAALDLGDEASGHLPCILLGRELVDRAGGFVELRSGRPGLRGRG